MNDIQVSAELILQYATMHKNEVALHMAIKALSEDGRKLKRNVRQLSRLLGKTPARLRDAEGGLKQKRLLQVHYTEFGTGDIPYWYVFDRPVNAEPLLPSTYVPIDSVSVSVEEEKPKSIWRRLRDAWVGTELDNFDLVDRDDENAPASTDDRPADGEQVTKQADQEAIRKARKEAIRKAYN
jgi:hypothetical protein